jgi:hypothetical protein
MVCSSLNLVDLQCSTLLGYSLSKVNSLFILCGKEI